LQFGKGIANNMEGWRPPVFAALNYLRFENQSIVPRPEAVRPCPLDVLVSTQKTRGQVHEHLSYSLFLDFVRIVPGVLWLQSSVMAASM